MHFRPILVPYMGFHVVITPPNLKCMSLNSFKFIQKSPINKYNVTDLKKNRRLNLRATPFIPDFLDRNPLYFNLVNFRICL